MVSVSHKKIHENKNIFLKDYYKDLFLKDLIKKQFENRFNIVGIFYRFSLKNDKNE